MPELRPATVVSAIVLALALGCSAGGDRTHGDAAAPRRADAGASPSSAPAADTSVAADAGGVGEEALGTAGPSGDINAKIVNVVDTARPPRVVSVEPVLERPSFAPRARARPSRFRRGRCASAALRRTCSGTSSPRTTSCPRR